jgi:3'(2'), 5'-bisphosphate nucleotidase
MDIQQLLITAIQAALKAGEEILKVYHSGEFAVEQKEDNSPLTLADKKAHESITAVLEATAYPILSEEGESLPYKERSNWPYFWMVDPLDGTKEFVKRNGEFTVNIALIHQQRAILGVIYVPVTRVLYYAAEDIGSYKMEINSFLNFDMQGLISQSLRLPLRKDSRNFTVVASRSHLSEKTEDFIAGLKLEHKKVDFISSGSSIKLCIIAEGNADVYPRFAPTMEWDTAAGQAICEIAGKQVIDYKTNQRLLYNKPQLENNWFIAS